MSKRRLAISALVASFALILTGCSSSDEGSSDGFVGVILPDAASSARWETADRGFLQDAFDAAGVEVDIQNANGDAAAFQTIADGMLSAGAKVLILVNLDSESAKAVQDKAAEQGVPTIDYDRLTLNGSASYYVSFDNEAVGRLQGEGIKACLDGAGKTKAYEVEEYQIEECPDAQAPFHYIVGTALKQGADVAVLTPYEPAALGVEE